MFEAVEELVGEHADLEQKLADPSVHADQANARRLNKRYAELTPIVAAYRSWKETGDAHRDGAGVRGGRPDFIAEVKELEAQREELTEKLRMLLVPRDPSDDKDVILRSRPARAATSPPSSPATCCACACGTPSGRLEDRDHRRHRVRARRLQGRPGRREGPRQLEPGQGVWARLKYEGGVHRVQRVPATESQGRIHTSAAGVLVTPEAEEVEVEINPNDLRIDRLPVLRAGRPVREHHRLRRADHAPADRCRRLLPEREEPAPEQGAGPAHPALPAPRHRPGGGRAGGRGRAPQPGSAPSTGRRRSGRTTSRRTASPTTASASRRTTWTRSSTGTSTR